MFWRRKVDPVAAALERTGAGHTVIYRVTAAVILQSDGSHYVIYDTVPDQPTYITKGLIEKMRERYRML